MPRRARGLENRGILIQTKVTAPLSAGNVVPRPRLTELLTHVAAARMTVVQAPAGYGKSTLLVQWYLALQERHERVGWLSLDAADRDPSKLLAYVVEALDTGEKLFDRSVHSLTSAGAFVASEVLLPAILNHLKSFAKPIFLFLDDLHHLTEPAARNVLANFVDRLPENVHVVAASREISFLRLACMRARGQLLELNAEALRFDRDEISRFLTVSGHSDLTIGTLATIEARTEGWIASLKLALLALRGQPDEDSFFSLISGQGRGVAAFFVETVLVYQSPEMREFLLATSILDRLAPDLCNVVTGRRDARAMIDQIEEMGLFLFSLDNDRQWYRYHNLFSDFLRRRSTDERPGWDRVLHVRASDWFRDHHLDAEAFEHAMKGDDPVRAADILNSCCSEMFYRGEVRLLVDYANRLPEGVLRNYPMILLDLAWWLIVEWRFLEAERLIFAVRGKIEELEKDESGVAFAAPDLRRLKLLLAHRQMMLDLFKDDVLAVEAPCRMLTREYRDADPYVGCSIYVSVIYAQRGRYRLIDLEELDAAARQYYERLGNPFAIVWHQSVAGPARFQVGDLRGAVKGLEEGLQIAAQFHGISALASLPALPLSEIYYEQNALLSAAELVERYLPMASEFGFVDQLIAGNVTKARLALLDGDEALAEATLRCALRVADIRGFDRLRASAVAELMRMYTLGGHLEKARELAKSREVIGSRRRLRPNDHTTLRDEASAIAWVRFEVMEARYHDALAVAAAWCDFAEETKSISSTVRWNILRAKILLVSGNGRGAQRALRRAMMVGASRGYLRSFVDEGAAIVDVLKGILGTDREFQAFAGNFSRLCEAAPMLQRAEAPALSDFDDNINAPLDMREREILSMVALGLLNREIGERLGLTEGTVKWYLQRVFDKLGIRRRTQAVRRAKQYGLLA
jgi:LuxR family maltose regulon positive regulatory protein